MTFREKARTIAALWRPHRRWLPLLGALTLVSGGVTVAYPLVLKETIDAAVAAGPGPRVFLVLGLIWLGRVAAGFYPAVRGYINVRIESRIRSDTFARILEKDYRFQRAFRTGDLVTRLTEDIGQYQKIAWFACSGIFRALDSAARGLLSIGAMFALEPRLALLSIAPLPFMLWFFYLVRRRLTEAIERQQRAISRTNDHLEAAFSGIKIVKAFAAEEGQRRKLAEILDARVPAQFATARLAAVVQAVDALAARAGQAIALAAGGVLVARGEIAFGTLYAFYVYLDMLVAPLQDLPVLLVSARQAFVSLGRIEEVARFPGAAAAPAAAPAEPRAPAEPLASVALRDVTFAYDGTREPALRGVSLEVRAGERVAIAGAVGSGKTTLLKALIGLLPPERGAVLANGLPVAEIGWRAFRARVGYVPQEPHLFSMTVRENVALGALGDGAASIERALAVAQVEPDLAGVRLGIRGGGISGGQRQRVAIARALARRPDLLVLDDATAALDAHNEDRFWDALDEAFPQLAVLYVTSRRASLRRATRVVLLDRGRVVAGGPHDDLIARSPAYRDLLAFEEAVERLGAALPAG